MTRTITFDNDVPCKIWKPLKYDGNYSISPGGIGRHRLAWINHYGADSLTSKEVVMHMCDEPGCYEITHLTLRDQPRNAMDKIEKERSGTVKWKYKSTNYKNKFPPQTIIGYLA